MLIKNIFNLANAKQPKTAVELFRRDSYKIGQFQTFFVQIGTILFFEIRLCSYCLRTVGTVSTQYKIRKKIPYLNMINKICE